MPVNSDLSKYKVVYNDRALRALAIVDVRFPRDAWPGPENPELMPEYVTILIINSDGVLEALTGEAKNFQFIPNLR